MDVQDGFSLDLDGTSIMEYEEFCQRCDLLIQKKCTITDKDLSDFSSKLDEFYMFSEDLDADHKLFETKDKNRIKIIRDSFIKILEFLENIEKLEMFLLKRFVKICNLVVNCTASSLVIAKEVFKFFISLIKKCNQELIHKFAESNERILKSLIAVVLSDGDVELQLVTIELVLTMYRKRSFPEFLLQLISSKRKLKASFRNYEISREILNVSRERTDMRVFSFKCNNVYINGKEISEPTGINSKGVWIDLDCFNNKISFVSKEILQPNCWNFSYEIIIFNISDATFDLRGLNGNDSPVKKVVGKIKSRDLYLESHDDTEIEVGFFIEESAGSDLLKTVLSQAIQEARPTRISSDESLSVGHYFDVDETDFMESNETIDLEKNIVESAYLNLLKNSEQETDGKTVDEDGSIGLSLTISPQNSFYENNNQDSVTIAQQEEIQHTSSSRKSDTMDLIPDVVRGKEHEEEESVVGLTSNQNRKGTPNSSPKHKGSPTPVVMENRDLNLDIFDMDELFVEDVPEPSCDFYGNQTENENAKATKKDSNYQSAFKVTARPSSCKKPAENNDIISNPTIKKTVLTKDQKKLIKTRMYRKLLLSMNYLLKEQMDKSLQQAEKFIRLVNFSRTHDVK